MMILGNSGTGERKWDTGSEGRDGKGDVSLTAPLEIFVHTSQPSS